MALQIWEGISGTWHYHLRDSKDKEHKPSALCGAFIMPTSIPLEAWDKTLPDYHLPEKWCAKCYELSKKLPEED